MEGDMAAMDDMMEAMDGMAAMDASEEMEPLQELPGLDRTPAENRIVCAACERPQTVCLCSVLPEEPLDTATRILILQHPHETKQKLATVPILKKCLKHCYVVQGRSFRPGLSALLDSLMPNPGTEDGPSDAALNNKEAKMKKNPTDFHSPEKLMSRKMYRLAPLSTHSERNPDCGSECASLALEEPKHFSEVEMPLGGLQDEDWREGRERLPTSLLENMHLRKDPAVGLPETFHKLVLFPAPNSCFLHDWLRKRMSKEGEGGDRDSWPSVLLLVIDGTWNHAQEMVKASMPFFSSSNVEFVCLPFDASKNGPSVGQTILKKEPRMGFVSTMEAVAQALKILEPKDGSTLQQSLIRVLKFMVDQQVQRMSKP